MTVDCKDFYSMKTFDQSKPAALSGSVSAFMTLVIAVIPLFEQSSSQSFFSLIGIHSMQGWTATTRHEVTRKRSTKRLKDTGNLFTKNVQLIGVF